LYRYRTTIRKLLAGRGIKPLDNLNMILKTERSTFRGGESQDKKEQYSTYQPPKRSHAIVNTCQPSVINIPAKSH
jgi:hypothetical protein